MAAEHKLSINGERIGLVNEYTDVAYIGRKRELRRFKREGNRWGSFSPPPPPGNCLGPYERAHCGAKPNSSAIYCDACYTIVYGTPYKETPTCPPIVTETSTTSQPNSSNVSSTRTSTSARRPTSRPPTSRASTSTATDGE